MAAARDIMTVNKAISWARRSHRTRRAGPSHELRRARKPTPRALIWAFPVLKREEQHGFGRAPNSCPIRQSYRTFPPHDKRGGSLAQTGDKAPPTIHHAPGDSRRPQPARRPASRTLANALARRSRRPPKRSGPRRKPRRRKPFRQPAPIPAWARASGRAGEGDPLFAAGAGLALLDGFLAP